KTAPAAIVPTIAFGMRLPKSPLITKPAAGNSGMSQMRSRKFMRLPLHQVDFIDVHCFLVLEHGDDNTQPHCRFSCGDRNDEDGESLPRHLSKSAGERDEVDVDGVHHEFDGHEDDHDVSSCQYADDANREKRRPEDQIVMYRNHAYCACVFLLARATEP